MPLQIGAHVSTAGGLATAWGRARDLGAECFQTHPSSPQQWRHIALDEAALAACQAEAAASPLPHFFHAPYLVSLATPNRDEKQAYIFRASKDLLVNYLRYADLVGAAGVVFHTNSHLTHGFAKVLPQIHAALTEILERAASK